MSVFRRFAFRLGSFFRGDRIEEDLSEELRLHVELQTEANIQAGMTPGEARRRALMDLGGIDQVKERYRDERRLRWIEDAGNDLRHSLRGLLRERAFTITVLAIFALCVAANVAIFSVVDGILLRPLPFPDATGIYTVYDSYPKAGFDGGISVPHYIERSRDITAFSESTAYRTVWFASGKRGAIQGIEALATSAGYFSLLKSEPALGRTFTEAETLSGSPHVVVLSDALWRSRFQADPAALGKALVLDDEPYTVIGVMPASFHFPTLHPVAWVPLVFSKIEQTDLYRHAASLGAMCVRLRPGVTAAQARVQLDALNERTLKKDPYAKMVVEGAGFHPAINGLHATMVAKIRPTLILLQSGALFLLLIGAVNLANLLAIRAVGRAREYSVRRALGAGSARLGRSIVLEILVLSVTGGATGIALGFIALRLTFHSFSDRLPFEMSVYPDVRVCAVSLAGAVLSGIMLSAPIVWQTLRENLSVSLSSESRTGTTTGSVQRVRQGLIVAQITLAFILLSGTGLLSVSLFNLLSVDPGFRPEHVLTGMFDLPAYRYPDAKRNAMVVQISTRIQNLPGVSSAGISTLLPFTWNGGGAAIAFKNHKTKPEEAAEPHPVIGAAGNIFAALGVPLVQGRLLGDSDVGASNKPCVVDTNFAKRFWPKGDALGAEITPDSGPNPEYYTIVGVVGAIRQNNLADDKEFGTMYVPYAGENNVMIALRTLNDPVALGATLAKIVREVDPDIELHDVSLMENRVGKSLSGRWVAVSLAGAFAGMALILAAIGIYGVLAYTVTQRRREIGVRMALGAQPGQILRMILSFGVRLLAIGLPIGVLGALFLGRAMASFLYGVRPGSVGVFLVVASLLSLAATTACVIPAKRAAKVSPSEALRAI
jgi:predicted permease